MKSLIFVTGSEIKKRDAQAILNFPIEIVDIDLDEIQSLDLEEIARRKAQVAFEKLQKPLFVDDVGLYIDAWSGFPGPFIKFLKQAGGNQLLLRMMQHEVNRHTTVVGVIAYHDGTEIYTFRGEAKGLIAKEERGDGGGWEPIFIPDGYDKTWAELGDEIKNSHSQRRRALDKFKEYLNQNEK